MLKVLETLEEQLPAVVDATKHNNAAKLGSSRKKTEEDEASRRRPPFDGNNIKMVLSAIIPYLRLFNSLEARTTWVEEMKCSTSEIQILSEFAPFILPASVKFNPSSDNSVDLLLRENFNSDEGLGSKTKYSIEEFERLQSHIRRWWNRSGRENTVSLASLRTDKSLSDVLPRVVVEDGVAYSDTPFVPLNLVDEGRFMENFFNEYEYTANARKVLVRYISKMDFSGN